MSRFRRVASLLAASVTTAALVSAALAVAPLAVSAGVKECRGHVVDGECVPSVPKGSKPVGTSAQPKVATSQSGSATEIIYSWSWAIPAAHYILLSAFSCPSNAPFVKGGPTFHHHNGEVRAHVADIRVDASDGVGFGTFRYGSFVRKDGRAFLTGWVEGKLIGNNVWSSPFKDGTFKLGVTCTNNSDANSAAGGSWSTSTSSTMFHVFPWEPA